VNDILSLLEAERAVRQTIVTLNRAFDDEDWQTVRASLTADFTGSAVVQTGERATIPDPDLMLNVMKDIAAQRRTAGTKYMHVLGEVMVTLKGNEAEASTFQTAYLYRAVEVSNPASKSGSHATYRLRRESGLWKIAAFDIVRLWLEGEAY
jgi:hypothetical protein